MLECKQINACTWGVNSVSKPFAKSFLFPADVIGQAYGVYLAHYLEDNVYPGATPLQYAFIGGLSIAVSMLLGPLATILLRRSSTRKVMSLGIVLEVGSLVAASFSTKIWHLFLTQGVLFGLGMGALFVGSSGVVSQWFDKKRSVAMGIAAAGSGIGK